MVEKTTETVSWSSFISWNYASTFKIMLSAQCKIFGSKRVKQLSVPFTVWKTSFYPKYVAGWKHC